MAYRGRFYIVSSSTGGRLSCDPYATERHDMPDRRTGVRPSADRVPEPGTRVEPFSRPEELRHPAHARGSHAALRVSNPSKRRRRYAIALATAGVALAAVAIGVFATHEIGSYLTAPSASATASWAKSTPREEWHRGEVPRLFQADPAWAEAPYGPGTLAQDGAAPLSLAMAGIGITGDAAFDPVAVAAFANEQGFAGRADADPTPLLTDGAAALGLQAYPLEPSEIGLRRQLNAGRPVICLLAPGTAIAGGPGAEGGPVVASAVNESGMLVVCDPRSPERSEDPWPFDAVLSRTAALWAYGPAETRE